MLDIKPSHKPVKSYYAALEEFRKHGVTKETSVRNAFQELLTTYARKLKWSFIEEYGITLSNKNKGSVDGGIVDAYSIVMGYWEAKDSDDDFKKEIKSKFEKGYPKSNILFQEPLRAVLYQDGVHVDDYDLTEPDRLCACLEDFFGYKADEQADWEELVNQFKDRIPDSAKKLVEMIEEEKKSNLKFKDAFKNFAELCRASINPNLADEAVEEMLVQHLLTSRIFGSVFDNPDFIRRNVIAAEIEKVIDALTSRSFNKKEFFAPLDHFYVALERRALSISEWSQKQSFLNTVYEKFFQGFAVKVADTHGIVYTPQPIVDFMVRSVEHILRTEFDRSLSDEGVHILDPFVGTGNFIMRIMREIKKTKLPKKYHSELHCNEVMLLPYYIASMNIEHEYFTQTGEYKPFEGVCLVDTFELAEPAQASLFSTENSERVNRQKRSPIFVIIGNPPYNAGQINENDNNKNRKYPVVDKRVNETYSKDSTASNKTALSDVYVKAFRWAEDRIGEEGIVAFISNNSFLNDTAFDGIRKHLAKDFSKIYHLNFKGNARTAGERRRMEAGNLFDDTIRVSVGITFLIRKKEKTEQAEISIFQIDDYVLSKDKKKFLATKGSIASIDFKKVKPDRKNNWLTEGMSAEFDLFIPLCLKEDNKETIFQLYSNGNDSGRDDWVYNFQFETVKDKCKQFCEIYNSEVDRYHRAGAPKDMDSFLINDEHKIKWTRNAKRDLRLHRYAQFSEAKIRPALYRPFDKEFHYAGKIYNKEVAQFPKIFPHPESEKDNVVICVTAVGNTKSFQSLMTNILPDLHLTGDSQCFPFYVYDEDGTHRRENITDWALEQFKVKSEKLKVKKEVTKWDIFYYVYGLLHHPEYRKKYAANLRRELPRIPISKDFWLVAEAGKKLADLHVNYEEQKEYRLEEVWKDKAPLNLHVNKMKLSKDKNDIIYNEYLTLRGIPPEAFEYKLGNRSAIDWIIDQYQISTDKRSGITNDPNRLEEPDYIVKLLRKVVTVSLETVKLVKEIEKLSLE